MPASSLRSRALSARQCQGRSYWLGEQMLGFRQYLTLPALACSFAFSEFFKEDREHQQWKFRGPRQARRLIGRLLEPGVEVERFSLVEQSAEQLFLQAGEAGFQLAPFEPGGQLELVAFVEVEPC